VAGGTQKEIGLIGAVNYFFCNHPRLTPGHRWLRSHLSKDEAIEFKIPFYTGCKQAAHSKFTLIQNAIGAQTDCRAPEWLFERRVLCGKSRIGD
jgi:hypothetical protein